MSSIRFRPFHYRTTDHSTHRLMTVKIVSLLFVFLGSRCCQLGIANLVFVSDNCNLLTLLAPRLLLLIGFTNELLPCPCMFPKAPCPLVSRSPRRRSKRAFVSNDFISICVKIGSRTSAFRTATCSLIMEMFSICCTTSKFGKRLQQGCNLFSLAR